MRTFLGQILLRPGLLALALLCPGAALWAASPTDALSVAQASFNAGDHRAAAKQWRSLATAGNSEAQVMLGLAYTNGWGVNKDPAEAVVWYRRAADQGNPAGQFLLGVFLVKKDKPDTQNGVMWLRKAAANGDSDAVKLLSKAEAKGWFGLGKNQKGRNDGPPEIALPSILSDG